MRIDDQQQRMAFQNVPHGDVFKMGSDYCIKVLDEDDETDAVIIHNGMAMAVAGDTEVTHCPNAILLDGSCNAYQHAAAYLLEF